MHDDSNANFRKFRKFRKLKTFLYLAVPAVGLSIDLTVNHALIIEFNVP
jgi:hypothetical protein